MQYRVWLVETPGEKFTESEVPIRSLQPNEVLVRIEASGVNPLDTKIRAGKATHAKQPLPAALGLDMAVPWRRLDPAMPRAEWRTRMPPSRLWQPAPMERKHA